MKAEFKKLSLKLKLTYVLLYCLDYGCKIGLSTDKIVKRLKVEYDFDPKRIRSCIDLVQDTESAIYSFAKYGLQKFSLKNYKGDGELYLRLYGILNAFYLQKHSIIELFEVLKIPNKKSAEKELNDLEIMEIRNIVGSHTINYQDFDKISPEGFSKNFFRITQMQLNAKSENMHAIDGFGNIREYNLYESFIKYNQVTERILYDCIISYFEKIIKSSKERNELLSHYEITGFEPFNYRALYKNDKLLKKRIRKTKKKFKLTSDDENLTMDDWINELSESEIENFLENEIMKMKIKTPPNNV